MHASQAATVMADKKQKTAVVIDVAIPAEGNIRKKEHDKTEWR